MWLNHNTNNLAKLFDRESRPVRFSHASLRKCPRVRILVKVINIYALVMSPARTSDIQVSPSQKVSKTRRSTLLGIESLFTPFRTLGVVANHVAFHVQHRSHKGAVEGPSIYILTCLGKSWALWEGKKMTVLFVGKCSASYNGFTSS